MAQCLRCLQEGQRRDTEECVAHAEVTLTTTDDKDND